MKPHLLLFGLMIGVVTAQEKPVAAPISLLNGKDLSGWYSFLGEGKNVDSKGTFKIEDGMLHVYAVGKGFLSTEKSYADYRLKVEFRWGKAATGKQNSGILFHFPEDAVDETLPKSIQCQVKEKNCGDIIFHHTEGQTTGASDLAGEFKRVMKSADFENPVGEWNTMEIVAQGDSVEYYVNGHLVNSATKLSVQRGKIAIQAEGSEVFYRNLTLTPLK